MYVVCVGVLDGVVGVLDGVVGCVVPVVGWVDGVVDWVDEPVVDWVDEPVVDWVDEVVAAAMSGATACQDSRPTAPIAASRFSFRVCRVLIEHLRDSAGRSGHDVGIRSSCEARLRATRYQGRGWGRGTFSVQTAVVAVRRTRLVTTHSSIAATSRRTAVSATAFFKVP